MTEEMTKQDINKFINKFELIKASGGSYYKRKVDIMEEGGEWKEGRVSRKILSELARATYKSDPPVQIGDDSTGEYFRLIQKNDNMYIYKSLYYANLYLVGIRGTQNFKDVVADAFHLFGALKHSSRYKTDERDLVNFIRRHPSCKLILTAHSLGGSIIKQLLKNQYINNHVEYSIAYNSAFQITDVFKDNKKPDEKIHQVYSSEDPLLKLRQVVEPDISQNPNVEIKQDDPNKNLLEGHTIENPIFDGGQFIPDEIKNKPKFVTMPSSIYKNVLMIREMKKNPKYKSFLKNVKTNKKINQWMAEDWINVKEALKGIHTPCGRADASRGKYPLCRPLKRVNKNTPITLPELLKVPGTKKKLEQAIKEKEKNPETRIQFKKMIEQKGGEKKYIKKIIKNR